MLNVFPSYYSSGVDEKKFDQPSVGASLPDFSAES